MPLLLALLADLSAYLESPEFLADARHPAHPSAFSRNRKLPLSVLFAIMLSAMRKSIQVELDTFFAHLNQQAQLMRVVSEQAFSQAPSKLSLTAIPQINTWLIARAEHYGFVKRWGGLRLVAADASTVRFGIRASRVKHGGLSRNPRKFRHSRSTSKSIMGFEVQWNGYAQLNITVLMERTLLSGVNLLRGDGDARFAWSLSTTPL